MRKETNEARGHGPAAASVRVLRLHQDRTDTVCDIPRTQGYIVACLGLGWGGQGFWNENVQVRRSYQTAR